MENIGVKQLRDNLGQILKRVERGEIIRILRHGKDIVELRPVKEEIGGKVVNRLISKGLLGGGTSKIGNVKSVKNLKPDKPVSDLVSEDRR